LHFVFYQDFGGTKLLKVAFLKAFILKLRESEHATFSNFFFFF